MWDLFNSVFDVLPLCGVIGQKVFCVHGSLSPVLTDIEKIQRLERKKEVPEHGPICDLLWSDLESIPNFTMSPRGAGYLYWRECGANIQSQKQTHAYLPSSPTCE
jgi:diadenosine tetraphosphatase ApaH/serine/threonine PP2A family protein phosphatase